VVPDPTPAPFRAGVIGHPIAHSKSPRLHGAAYAYLDFNCDYAAIDTPPDSLAHILGEMRADPAWRGMSVTMPHKSAALPFMDELAPGVADLGVINTVLPTGEGDRRRLIGHNTDVEGIVRAVRHAGAVSPRQALILGGGGTASAAVAALARMGVDQVVACVRSPRKAQSLVELGDRAGTVVELRDFAAAAELCVGSPLVISTLPPHGADELAAALNRVPSVSGGFESPASRVLLDVAYDPWPSALAEAWSARGGVIVPGLEMLLYQAVAQVKLFAGDVFRDESNVINVMCDAVDAPRR
jgi:shikimate dehydrogenase